MPFGKKFASSQSGDDVVYLDLSTPSTKGEDVVGFRQKTGEEVLEDGSIVKKYDYHEHVIGTMHFFSVKEQKKWNKPEEKEAIGYLTLVNPNEPKIVIAFRIEGYHGSRMVGLINAAVADNNPQVFFRATFTPAGTQLGDQKAKQDRVFLTSRANDARGEKREPLYVDEQGHPLLDDHGRPAKLPEAETVMVGRTPMKNYSASDEIVACTALHLMNHFAAQRQGAKDAPDAAAHDEASIDLHEAAHAAAPQG
jgi:hypothetical protein